MSNIVGEYLFLSTNDFKALVNHELETSSSCWDNLLAKHFIVVNNIDDVVDLLAIKCRTKKHFLNEFTSLHMVVTSLRCNSNCSYCQASKKDLCDHGYDMTRKTAQKTVDKILQCPGDDIKVEFQGGEPTLNWDIIKYIVEDIEYKNLKIKKQISYVICTNLLEISTQQLKWLKKYNCCISTSLDGHSELHNQNRPAQKYDDSHKQVTSNIEKARTILGYDQVSALMTTTSYSLDNFEKIIDEYLSQGFNGIFLRSLNPYGFAQKEKHTLAYPMDDFIINYKKALDYIIDLNRNGHFFVEELASIFLSKILTPFSIGFVDLQNPAGIAIAGVIYDYDGEVYVSDEGRMMAATGDKFWSIGNVHTHKYHQIFNGKKLRYFLNHSILETQPLCSTCAFIDYCGADPVRNYNEQRDIIGHKAKSNVCKKNKEVIKHLLMLLKQNDPEINRIFWSWITRRNINKIR